MALDTRTRLLEALWHHIRSIDPLTVRNYPAAARAIDAGAAADDVIAAMTAAAYEAVFGLLYLFTGEHTEIGNPDANVGWALLEVELHADGSFTPTGTDALNLLFQELLTADPTGNEGRDLFA